MAQNPFVKSIVATAPAGVSAPGFGVPMLLSYEADVFGASRARLYGDMDAIEDDFAPGTVTHRYATAFFAKHPGATARLSGIVIGRGANKPTLIYTQSLSSVVAGATYAFDVAIGTINDTHLDVVAGVADVAITTVTAATDILTKVAHGLTTGTVVFVSTTGVLPAATPSLAANTPYFVIRVDDDNVKLATSLVNATAGTAVDLTGAGTGTMSLVTTGNDVLAERIVAALNSVAGKNYTAATTGSTGSKTWAATGTTAGGWFAIGVDHNLITSAVTNTDPGIAADLAAVRNENQSWYELHTAFNSTAMVLAAATWIESNPSDLQYHADVSATSTVNAVVGTATANDVADTLRTLSCARTAVWYHPDPRQCLSAAVAGRVLPVDPGGIQYAHKQVSGVTPVSLTDTQRENLAHADDFNGKNANSYSLFGGAAITFYGRVAIGEWIDVVRDNDSVNANMEAGIYNLALQNDKIGLTPDGRQQIKNVMQAVLKAAVRAGIYRDDEESSPQIDIPLISSISPTDRRKRKFRIAKWSAQLVNAVVFFETAGTVTT